MRRGTPSAALGVSLSSHKLLSHPQGGGHCLGAAHGVGFHGRNSARADKKAEPYPKEKTQSCD